jgi:glycosyltransferase involved in cell wall biosynthesis
MFRFHLLGLAHIPTHREISPCAYTQKVVKLAAMLKSLRHTVIFYGGEGSEVDCDEFVRVISAAEREACYGQYDWQREFFRHDGHDAAHQTFSRNAVREILSRCRERDFLLCPMGNYNKPVADAMPPGVMVVESGIGYTGVFAQFKVFESYAWMHYVYGLSNQADGNWYDGVIPNYFAPGDFPYQETKEDYFLFIGRLIRRKGLDVAVQVTRELGARLIVAGQGSLVNSDEGLEIADPHVEHVGTVGPAQRAELLGKARAVFVPTYYIEPFGGVAVESQLCGTPVITTDWGAFAETVLHGVTGFRCRTFDDFLWAAGNVHRLSPRDCRHWALGNYSMERIRWMYQEYFGKLHDLWGSGWYECHPTRRNLDWLRKWQP